MNHQTQIDRIQSKIKLAKTKDNKRKVFGADSHKYKIKKRYLSKIVLRIKTLSNLNTLEFGERVIHHLWTHGEYRRQIKKVQQRIYNAHEKMREALPKIGLIYPEHTQAGLFVWVDTGQDTGSLALQAYKDGWLVAPGQLFYPDASASTYLRLNVSTTSDEFLAWLGEYLAAQG